MGVPLVWRLKLAHYVPKIGKSNKKRCLARQNTPFTVNVKISVRVGWGRRPLVILVKTKHPKNTNTNRKKTIPGKAQHFWCFYLVCFRGREAGEAAYLCKSGLEKLLPQQTWVECFLGIARRHHDR